MARSVGQAAAEGLTTGFVLGRDTQNMARDQERRDEALQIAAEDRQLRRASEVEALTRQKNQDRLAAIRDQRKNLGTVQQGLVDAGITPSADAQRMFADQVGALDKAEQEHLSKISGFDLAGAQKQADVDMADISKATDVRTLKPGQLTRAVTVKTGGRAIADYQRADGQPSIVEQGGADFIQGIQSGDMARVLKGANIVYAPALKAGIGKPSPHGGTIVGKEFVGLTPAPGSDPNDPKFIPTVRVYVDSGKGGGKPTGHYDAPLTEGRGSEDDAPVKMIGMKDGMEFVGQNLHLAELLNTPEARAKLQEDAQAGDFDPAIYQAALAKAGIKDPAKEAARKAATKKAELEVEQLFKLELEREKNKGRMSLADANNESRENVAEVRARATTSAAATRAGATLGAANVRASASGGGDGSGLSTDAGREFKSRIDAAKAKVADLKGQAAEARAEAALTLNRPEPLLGGPEARAAHATKIADAERKLAATLKSVEAKRGPLEAEIEDLGQRLNKAAAPKSLADGKRPDTGGAAAAGKKAPYAEGTKLKGPDGKMYVVKDGKPVPQ